MNSIFSGTADYYRKYRPGIPTEVADLLHAAASRSTPRRLLDIGTGTGLVIEALAAHFDEVIGNDPDADMLAEAETALRPILPKDKSLQLVNVAAEIFLPPQGWKADLVTISRTFHWLDQSAVLGRLDSQVCAGGAVAIFGDNSFWAAESDWKIAVREVVKDFLGEERRAGQGTFKHHNRPYSEILEESAFSVVEEHIIPVTRTWKAESVLGYLYSTSFAARPLFGERLPDFEANVREVLLNFNTQDTYLELNEFTIRIGRRPSL